MKKHDPKLWHGFTVEPDNLPLSRSGVYKITHLESGMSYIGASTNVAKRCFEHACNRGNVTGFSNVLSTYTGKGANNRRYAFLLTPLFYTIDPKAVRKGMITKVEDAMIEAYDSTNHGWNQSRPDVASLCQLPKAKAKRKETEASDETKTRRSVHINNYWSNNAIRLVAYGKVLTMRQWGKELGLSYVTLYWRYKHGKEILPIPYVVIH